MVTEIFNFSANGIPVCMHIYGRHEDGNLYALVFEIFGVCNSFNSDYFSIARADYITFVERIIAPWVAEELEEEEKNNDGNAEDNKLRPIGSFAEEEKDSEVQEGKHQHCNGEYCIAFAV